MGKQGGRRTPLSLAGGPAATVILIPGTFRCSPVQPSFEILVRRRVPFSSRCSSFLAPVQLFVLPSPLSAQRREKERKEENKALPFHRRGRQPPRSTPRLACGTPHPPSPLPTKPLGKHKSLPTSTAASSQPPSPPPPAPFHRSLLCTPLNFSSQALQPSTPPFSSIPSPPTSSPHIGKKKKKKIVPWLPMHWHLLRTESHCTHNMPGRSNPAHSCPSAGELQCSRAHTRVRTRVCTHTCHGAGRALFASLGVAVNTNFPRACVWQLNFSSCLWGQEKNRGAITREGGCIFLSNPNMALSASTNNFSACCAGNQLLVPAWHQL